MSGDTKSSVNFHINGEKFSVNTGSKVDGETALVDYIRDVANLKGTKVMCREGGCGACIVTTKVIDPVTGAEVTKSVNSCLTPVLSCDGWDISTIESLGNKHEGYSVIQNRLVNFHGTQCGYCTPGMVMTMNSLLGANENLGMADVEKNIDGNICRCTGYRPILEAFKSLAKDAPSELRQKCADIEECTTCPKKKGGAQEPCAKKARASTGTSVKLASGEEWVTAKSLDGALTAAAHTLSNGTGKVRFVAGNTSTGIYKNTVPYQTYIDVNGIAELKKTNVNDNEITLGGGSTITETINLLNGAASKPGFEYGKRIATHLERVANVSIRNNGSLAGNLMIKYWRNDFPSDIFVILEAVGATVTLASLNLSKNNKATVEDMKPLSMLEFLKADMKLKLIKSIHLPNRKGWHYRSFKITRRFQNAHAYVNAAIMLKTNASFTVEEKPRIVFGGISAAFNHATATETGLQGKSLVDAKTIKDAMEALEKEVQTEGGVLESPRDYRVQLTKTLLYKTILEIIGDKASAKIRSGAADIARNLMTSKQVMDSDNTSSALYKNIPKYEAGIQASGEAEYTGDIPSQPNELFAAYVLSTVACADIKDIDASAALKIPGVVRFITAKDVPGDNNLMKLAAMGPPRHVEPVFADAKIEYHGQAIGLILATSKELAFKGVKLVKVTYDNIKKPVVDIQEAVAKAKADGTFDKQHTGKFSNKPLPDRSVVHTIKGSMEIGSQHHFYMEPQAVVCHPREDGIDVYCPTQWMDGCQNTISVVLDIPTNAINLQSRRLGGGFGGKASKSFNTAAACAVACWVTNRPTRLVLDIDTNLRLLGRRHPYLMPYEVGFDERGRIASLKTDIICDSGYAANEPTSIVGVMHLQNVYKAAGWEAACSFVSTDTASNTFCRAPGSTQAVALIESIMEHIAHYLKKDSMEVREANYLETGDEILFSFQGDATYDRENLIPGIIENMKKTDDYDARKAAIEKFNKENRWKKRGIAIVPVRYGVDYWSSNMPASIAIYHHDGHIAVSHGGIEMGQGLNTKLIQTVAEMLQVPVNMIRVKPSNTFVGANGMLTAGSLGSEIVCYSAMKACEEIRENLRPILEKLEKPSWEKLISEAHNAKVKLSASYTPTAKDELKGYDVWVLNCTEVEIDVLTGEYKITRTDLYEDTGKSLSPGIDLGQIEGGYIYGQGLFTTEKIVHDKETGKLLTNGTWDYKVPEGRDLPEHFKITLLSDAPNPNGILRSKATGEPSTNASYAVVIALRNAIASARADAGNTDWFDMCHPTTPEDVARLCLTKESHLTL